MLLMIILKCIFVYFLILLSLKFMGKREIGQVSLFDFSIILIIANIAVIGVEDSEHPFYYYVIPILILAVIQKLIAFISMKSTKLRYIFDGKESIIIYKNKLNIKEMKKMNYNMDDLIVQLRLKNVYDLSSIRYAFIEANGQISIVYNEIVNDNVDCYPFGLIISGKINKNNLKYANVTEKWLIDKLESKGIYKDKIKDLYYVSRNKNDIYILDTISLDE